MQSKILFPETENKTNKILQIPNKLNKYTSTTESAIFLREHIKHYYIGAFKKDKIEKINIINSGFGLDAIYFGMDDMFKNIVVYESNEELKNMGINNYSIYDNKKINSNNTISDSNNFKAFKEFKILSTMKEIIYIDYNENMNIYINDIINNENNNINMVVLKLQPDYDFTTLINNTKTKKITIKAFSEENNEILFYFLFCII
jgi:hypothetical protein